MPIALITNSWITPCWKKYTIVLNECKFQHTSNSDKSTEKELNTYKLLGILQFKWGSENCYNINGSILENNVACSYSLITVNKGLAWTILLV